MILTNKRIYAVRCACLGLDALAGLKIFNRQKFRVDSKNCNSFKSFIKIIFISKIFYKNEIKKLIYQQAVNFWPIVIKKSNFFIMDTYSELTDRKFNIFNEILYSHRSDLKFNNDLYEQVDDLDSEDKFYYSYKSFFTYIKSFNNDINIIVILFPVKFDNRYYYSNRYAQIYKSLMRLKITNLTILEIPGTEIEKNIEDDFPYHFSEKTISYVRNKINLIINDK